MTAATIGNSSMTQGTPGGRRQRHDEFHETASRLGELTNQYLIQRLSRWTDIENGDPPMTTCDACGYDAQTEFAFCPKCGKALKATCASCGSVCPPDFAFCPRCGGAMHESPPTTEPSPPSGPGGASIGWLGPAAADDPVMDEADRRPVTVLFADLSGFTSLSERLDPEDVRAIQTDLFEGLSAAVLDYGGFVEKFAGDAVMAVFGAPVAHEDDPQRALHAALAMQDWAKILSSRWEDRLGQALLLHIGVNTGEVVAGILGNTAQASYVVTGDTVNTSARLQSTAGPGETLVSEATYRLARHRFTFESLGAVEVRGKAEPITVYRLAGVLEAAGTGRGLEVHGLMAPLVGRDVEMTQMKAAFERVLCGQAQVVSLTGDAGVGKSRLMQEFLEWLDREGRLGSVTVRTATCTALGQQPYGVLASFFRETYGVLADDSLEVAQTKVAEGLRSSGAGEEEIGRISPMVGHLLGLETGAALRYVEPEQLKRQILLAIRVLCERQLETGPLILVVENLQWADAASLEVLGFMVDRLAERALMMLFSHRPDFEGGAFVVNKAAHETIRLKHLTTTDCEEILGAFFGDSLERIPVGLRELAVERAGGHPFYLEEIVRSFVLSGTLVRDEDGWSCPSGEAAVSDVPPTVQALLLSRVDRLPTEGRRLLQEASVLGVSFGGDLLGAVCTSPQTAPAIMETLLYKGLLEEASDLALEAEVQGRRYRFAHTMVQEVVYESLLMTRRAELHGRAGRALEELCGCEDGPQRLEDLVALGHHFSLSEDRIKGVRYLMKAGERARAIYANEDAIRHYTRALEALDVCGACDGEDVIVRERLADLLGSRGQRKKALSLYEQVRVAGERENNRAAQARIHRKMGGLHWDGGDRSRATEAFEVGLALLDDDHIERAHLLQEMGRLAFRSGDSHAATEWASQALDQAKALEDCLLLEEGDSNGESRKEVAEAISHAHNTLGIAFARMDRVDEAVAHIEQSVQVAQEHDLLQVVCRGLANLGVLYSNVNPQRAIETCLTGLQTATKIGDLGLQSRLQANLAVAYCALTDRCEDEGRYAAQAAIDLDRQLGQLDHLAVPLIVLGQIHQCHDEWEPALKYYREALGLAEEIGDPQLLFPCYEGLGTVFLDLGDAAQGEKYILKAQEVCVESGLDPDSLIVLPFLA